METGTPLSAAHEAALSKVETRWGAERASVARDQLTALLRLATEAADGSRDVVSQRTALEDLVTLLCAVSAQEASRLLLRDDQVVPVLADALRQCVRLGVPGTGLGLARPVEALAHDLGPDHPHTLTARFALASAYRAAGDPQRAAALGEQVVEGTVRLLGPDHPRALTARHGLASAYRAAGQPRLAVPMYEQLAADTARLLGSHHPDALSARNNLAQAYESAGDPARALALYEELVHDAERALPPHHPYRAVFVRGWERARGRGGTGDTRTDSTAGATQRPGTRY